MTYHGAIFNDHITGAVIDDICVWPSHSRDNRSYTNMEKVITWLLLYSMAVDCIKSDMSKRTYFAVLLVTLGSVAECKAS